jgi:hypothetical protein
MMKTRTIILLAIAACLLIGSVSLAQSNGPPPAQYVVARGAASGGHYRLTGQAWHVSGASSGGGYRLMGPASPSGGNQCCCTYLPCLLRNYH